MVKVQMAIASLRDTVINLLPKQSNFSLSIAKFIWTSDFLFPVSMWLLSRLWIGMAMLLIAPHLPALQDGVTPHVGWGVFDAWDSVHYRAIATEGYEFIHDGKQHNLAFFPLFPICIFILMKLGFSFEIAGLIINNLAFLGTLYFLYAWVKKQCGITIAHWTIAVMAYCPMSLFTGVIYTEGLYLLLSTMALRAFDEKQYLWTAICGGMATATRPTGMVLIPAFFIAAWKQNKPPIAYIAGLLSAIGLLIFSGYCALNFHDFLAFIAAQKGWRPSFGFDWQGWLNMFMQIPFGNNWYYGWVENDEGGIKDLWYPLFFGLIVIGSSSLLYWRKYFNSLVFYAGYAIVILSLIIANQDLINNLLNVSMILGSTYLLWYCRQQLTPVMVVYGFCGIGLLLASGGTISLSRLAYGIVPLNIAIGMWLSRYPRQAYLVMGLFITLLSKLAIGFTQELWVG
jgi:Gpi18-like mannosyltransferase